MLKEDLNQELQEDVKFKEEAFYAEELEIVEVSSFSQETEERRAVGVNHQRTAAAKPKTSPLWIMLTVTAVAVSAAALIFSLGKTDLVIGQGELYVQGGVVNELLGNLIRNDLSNKVPKDVKVREIGIEVILYGGAEQGYSKVSDIGESDSVTAEIVFFPQESVRDFALDCRAVLDVMKDGGVVYDKIMFMGEDRSTSVTAELSGRFSMDITAEEIMDITYYFGEIKAMDD